MVTRSKTRFLKPKSFVTMIFPEPSCYALAKGIPKWEEAMLKQFNSLIANETWKYVSCLNDVDPLGRKWLYHTKLKYDSLLEKYKARVVI